MRRFISLLVPLLVLLLTPRASWAFHAGDVFGKPPGAGGGGGVFYIGLPSERGWNCSACHLDAVGTISVSLDADARADLERRMYVPLKVYALTATLDNEHEGLPHPGFNSQANFNSLAVAIVDARDQPAGSLGGYAPEVFYSSGPATIVSAGQQVGANQWQFTWTAPAAGTGPITIHMAAVDGNGAESPVGVTLTDPWNDDVFVGALLLGEGAPVSSTSSRPSSTSTRVANGSAVHAPVPDLAWLSAALLPLFFLPARRRYR